MKNKLKKNSVKILTLIICIFSLLSLLAIVPSAEDRNATLEDYGYEGYDDGYYAGLNGLHFDDSLYDEDDPEIADIYRENYRIGYNNGIDEKVDGFIYEEVLKKGEEIGYEKGYKDGELAGINSTWSEAYGAGAEDMAKTSSTLKDMVFAIFDAPSVLIDGMLNFDVFGINLAGLVKTIVTLLVVAVVVFALIKMIF